MVPQTEWIQPIRNGFRLMRTHIAFLSTRLHNLPSKVRLCNNQTARNVYMSMQQ